MKARAAACWWSTPSVPCCATCCSSSASEVHEAGADGFITKPIAPTQLLERMAALLGLHWTY